MARECETTPSSRSCRAAGGCLRGISRFQSEWKARHAYRERRTSESLPPVDASATLAAAARLAGHVPPDSEGSTLTTAILFGGVVLALIAGAFMVRPAYRFPALVVAILAIPGNVDNLMPQMGLDPNPLANNTAPAVSVVDLLLAWAIVLTIRERHSLRLHGFERAAVLAAGVAAGLAAVSALVAFTSGVEPAAAVRGALVFGRVAAIIFLAIALRDQLGNGLPIGAATVIGGVALLGNGIYTSATNDLVRFTASTLGRNGFSLALVLAGVGAGGFALSTLRDVNRPRWQVIGAIVVACGCIFGAVATGTRMSFLALVPTLALGLGLARFWQLPRGLQTTGVAMLVLVVTVAAAVLLTAGGGRAVLGVTDVGDTVGIITDPEGEVEDSALRSRAYFWSEATAMAIEHPAFGVGPFQWNFERYERDPQSVRVVADPHNGYLQIAAEFGLPTLVAYLALLAIVGIGILHAAWRHPSPFAFATTALLVTAMVYPITELTNSHLFNVRMGPAGWIFMACALVVLRGLLMPVTAHGRHESVGRATAATSASG